MKARIIPLIIVLIAVAHPAWANKAVDLELVLAIDASSSVSFSEWRLQRHGYAVAFRDPRVQSAIASGPHRRIGVAVVIWGGATVPKRESPWFVLSTPADAERFAAFMDSIGRGAFGETGIGEGVAAAIRKLDSSGLAAPLHTIDVSGDGRETPSPGVILMPAARAMARKRHVTINGLAIINEEPDLTSWYRDHLITGPGSFVMTVANYGDFAPAITRKLIHEIEYEPRLSLR